jgi:transposase
MISSRTINLAIICESLPGNARILSWYRRLQRFVAEVYLNQYALSIIIVQIMNLCDAQKWILCLDRTNWKFGKRHINILYLAVSWNMVAVPLFFCILEGKASGNSDHMDRIDILESFIKIFGKDRIKALTADREFIGEVWLKYLDNEKIPYVIRLKENGQLMAAKNGVMKKISEIFCSLSPGEVVNLRRKIGACKSVRSITAIRNNKGELIALVHSDGLKDSISLYSERWQIERMFKAFKSSGFNSEATHITNYDRLTTIMSVMAIAFSLSYKAGEIENELSPIEIKKHGYMARSIFRHGLAKLCKIFADIGQRLVEWITLCASIIKGCGSV